MECSLTWGELRSENADKLTRRIMAEGVAIPLEFKMTVSSELTFVIISSGKLRYYETLEDTKINQEKKLKLLGEIMNL